MALIHHTILKQAAKFGIELTVDTDTVVARDTNFNVDQEYSGMNAKALLALVLSKRPVGSPGGPKPEKVAKAARKPVDADEGGEDEVDADEDEKSEGASVVKPAYKAAYKPFNSTCGDEFTDAMRICLDDETGELDLGKLREVGAANDVDVQARWGHLNPGMQRMNLGNVLRGMVGSGKVVVIGDTTFNPEPKAVK